MTAPAMNCRRVRLDVRGRVQGVGFRPQVYRLAVGLGLAGVVGNDPRGAFIEVEGDHAAVEQFLERLRGELPPLATIAELAQEERPAQGATAFRIESSSHLGDQQAEISPDVATCRDCCRELMTPVDRRFGYAFINCTNCGPRYSLVNAIPYDRENTTMARFRMCPECQSEYDDPRDRRFHAQPNACPACGPRIWFATADGRPVPGDPFRNSRARLQAGEVIAVKGLGGFHLACRADRDEAVLELRRRKNREARPFALMAPALADAEALVRLDAEARALLCSWRAPIVLAPARPGTRISQHVAPGCGTLGLMLPYTPLHRLLFLDELPVLVMTSGNPSDEPLCADNDEAIRRLGDIADGFLLHDRDIERRVDDSVIMLAPPATPRAAGRLVPVRRARGYVPEPIAVPCTAPRPVLATGGDLKSAVCLLQRNRAVLSEHLGELQNPAAFRNFTGAVERLSRITGIEPEAVACDMHPAYHSSRYAKRLGLREIAVQHHHAHIAACMAENGLGNQPVLGVAADGTGYGTDGGIWGCELLHCDYSSFRRLGHLRCYPLIGGDAAAIETWRPAAALMHQAFGDGWQQEWSPPREAADGEAVALLARRLASDGPSVRTSSLGRLFDATACLLGIAYRNRFEAEAAMALETAAAPGVDAAEPFPFQLCQDHDALEFDVAPMIRDLVRGRRDAVPAAELAARFHRTIATMLVEAVLRAADSAGRRPVLLSGGCFLNRLLLQMTTSALAQEGMEVFSHSRVPPGDGGIALGQAVIAAERDRENSTS